MTSHDPAMVGAMLRLFRDHADEIVVAVDSRVDPRDLAPLVEAADTAVRFEQVGPPECSRPWLVQLCAHQTVLMVDGDEVPSAALLRDLSELVADDTVVQSRIARRWCFPDERHWLAERPWWPDYQRRLLRRGPELDFDLGIHGGVRPALPARYVDEPVYHLACILATFASRRNRARVYEAARPGLVAVGGGPMNDTLYVPEHFATCPPDRTPDEDVALLRSVLGASADRATRSPTPVELPLVTADEVAGHHPVDGLQAQGYRATLRVVELDRRTEPGNDT
ncbi:MAG TPA: hypothetical protein VK549_11190, partial [Acidimicrobiia bacterium]|nr:hypothetical protein [Acidimicrobiia bacterium]